MAQHITQIFPDELVELPGRNKARGAFLVTTRHDRMALASAGIVGIFFCLHLPIPPRTGEMADSTAHQRTQQVGMSCIVATGILLVLCKLCLHEIKLVLRDDGGNLSHSFPFVWSSGGMASMIVTPGTQGRLSMTRSSDTIATNKNRSGVDRIAQNAPHRRLIPPPFPSGGRDLLTHQILGQPNQTLMVLVIALKQFRDHRRLGWLHPHACRVTGTERIDAIAIGRLRRGAIRVPLDTSADARV